LVKKTSVDGQIKYAKMSEIPKLKIGTESVLNFTPASFNLSAPQNDVPSVKLVPTGTTPIPQTSAETEKIEEAQIFRVTPVVISKFQHTTDLKPLPKLADPQLTEKPLLNWLPDDYKML